jgi:hypothetical protein
MLHYFWRALERREDVELCVVGPFTGARIPWNGGMTLPQKYVKTPDIALPENSQRIKPNSILVEAQLPWDEVDLWLQVDAGWHVSNRPTNAKVVAHVQTDPHVLKDHYKVPKSYSDYSFCMQHAYMEEGEFYLPYAYDPTIHFPVGIDKIYDACMIGLHYEQRNNLVKRLRDRGLSVHYSIGEIYNEYREIYNQSRIALSWSSLEDTPARVFEALGMGLPLVCNRTPDLSNFFVEGEHYLGFTSVEEAEKQTLKLLSDKELRLEIANAGHRKVQRHTWDNRVQEILETCRLI